MNVSKTKYFYDSTTPSVEYSELDFYKKVNPKDYVYINMSQYEVIDFLPSTTVIVKDTILRNELVVTPSHVLNKNQPKSSIYYLWKNNQWEQKSKHEYNYLTEYKKEITDYSWSAKTNKWETVKKYSK